MLIQPVKYASSGSLILAILFAGLFLLLWFMRGVLNCCSRSIMKMQRRVDKEEDDTLTITEEETIVKQQPDPNNNNNNSSNALVPFRIEVISPPAVPAPVMISPSLEVTITDSLIRALTHHLNRSNGMQGISVKRLEMIENDRNSVSSRQQSMRIVMDGQREPWPPMEDDYHRYRGHRLSTRYSLIAPPNSRAMTASLDRFPYPPYRIDTRGSYGTGQFVSSHNGRNDSNGHHAMRNRVYPHFDPPQDEKSPENSDHDSGVADDPMISYSNHGSIITGNGYGAYYNRSPEELAQEDDHPQDHEEEDLKESQRREDDGNGKNVTLIVLHLLHE